MVTGIKNADQDKIDLNLDKSGSIPAARRADRNKGRGLATWHRLDDASRLAATTPDHPTMIPLKQGLTEIVARYGIRDVYVFGSRSREIAARVGGRDAGGQASTSDVDVAVQPLTGVDLSPRARVRLVDELETLFGVSRVDLVILSEAPVQLSIEVVRGELLYTTDPLAQAEHELYVLRRAADLAPFLRERVRQILYSGAR
jgi:predicted nucleotidyltransferase